MSRLTSDMVKGWREKTGATQDEAAEQLGISKSAIRNFERGNKGDKDNTLVEVPLWLDWAISAVANGLRPYSEMILRKKK